MNVFLYDYANAESDIVLFGYTESGKKCELYLTGFGICLDIVIDPDYFSNAVSLQMTIEQIEVPSYGYKRKSARTLKTVIDRFELVQGRGFKGFVCYESYTQLMRVYFKKFDEYEQFKRAVNAFNQYVINMQLYYVQDVSMYAKTCYASFVQKTGLKQLRKAPIRMLEDDSASKYIYKLQRHTKFYMSGWNCIEGIRTRASTSSRLCFSAELCNIKPIELEQVPLDIMSWDIEVSTESGKFDSNGYNPNNKVICICYTVGNAMKPAAPRRQVCIIAQQHDRTVIKGEQGTDIEIIYAADELQMIHTFAECIYYEDPAFITGFNESSFDWPFLKQKLEYYSDTLYYGKQHMYKSQEDFRTAEQRPVGHSEMLTFAQKAQGVVRQCGYKVKGFDCVVKHEHLFKSSDVKVTAGNTRKGISINIPGIICIDTRTLLMKDQVLERRSLNEYLKANNLPLKLEVSFDEMNTAYKSIIQQSDGYDCYDEDDTLTLEESLELCGIDRKRDMYTLNRIYEYCVYDSDACRLLWIKRNLVYQYIEVCKLSYTPLRAGFLNANGIKVRNMVAAFAHDKGFAVPMSTTSSDIRLRDKRLLDEYEKYPGAYVPEPHKGVSLTPVIALDFASLYPSIIMAHNLSPENVIEEKDIVNVQENANALYDLVTVRGGQQYLCNRVIVDFEKDYRQARIQAYVRAREVDVGVYPSILQNLFNMRAQVKKVLEQIDEHIKEESNPEKTRELLFQYSLVDAKQKAIKVFMNTFYGETGNQQSSLFDVVISGGTTSYGYKYIKQVHRAIGERDCEVVAGDTDSIYFRPRASHYYLTEGCIDSTEVLRQANAIADQMRAYVNEMIGKQTHGFLKMAFEELLCPSVFTGKKKYFGAMYKPGDGHRDHIDVAERGSVLVKGIDFIKSYYPELVKRHGYYLINIILNQFNDMLKTGVSAVMFQDSHRHAISDQLLDLCKDKAIYFVNDVKSLTPEQYGQLSSKKRIRDVSGGEMAGFRQRLVHRNQALSVESSGEVAQHTEQLRIYIEYLYDLNIPVPQSGEVLDIVYIKPVVNKKDLKSAEKMHLLEFASKMQLYLDYTEYLKMFATSTIRISLAACLPPNIDSLDSGTQKLLFYKAQKELKCEFGPDNLNKTRKFIKTDIEIHRTEDVMHIRESLCNAPVLQSAINAKAYIQKMRPVIRQAKALPAQDLYEVIHVLMDAMDSLDPNGLVYATILGFNCSDRLFQVLDSHYDSRVSHILNVLSPDICSQMQDVQEDIIQQVINIHALIKAIQGKSTANAQLILNQF